jgi:membrane-bound serine protease (ClpP class)
MIGAPGRVLEVTPEGGWALVHGERWQVRADVPLTPGQAVRVVSIDDLTLAVVPATAAAAPAAHPVSNQG